MRVVTFVIVVSPPPARTSVGGSRADGTSALRRDAASGQRQVENRTEGVPTPRSQGFATGGAANPAADPDQRKAYGQPQRTRAPEGAPEARFSPRPAEAPQGRRAFGASDRFAPPTSPIPNSGRNLQTSRLETAFVARARIVRLEFAVWSLKLPKSQSLSATRGSTRLARCAGIRQAAIATALSSTVIVANVTGSVGEISASSSVSTRLKP